ncbi:MAG: WD40 repeat domain-containing protein [Microcystaceae cyanobacterium]
MAKKNVSGSYDKMIKIWDLATGKQEQTLRGHEGWVHSVTITPDGKKIISGSEDITIKIWNLETKEEDRIVEICNSKIEKEEKIQRKDNYSINSVAVTSDDKIIISGSTDKTVKVWDIKTGNCIATFTAEAAITCVAVAPDNVAIVAGDAIGRVHFLKLMNAQSSSKNNR